MNHKEQLIELAMLVIELEKATDAYGESDRLNGQERFGILCQMQELTFTKAKEMLAAVNRPEEHPFHAFQREVKEWAADFFRPQFGLLGKPVTLGDAVASFRQTRPRVTVHPFLKNLEAWAKESGLSFSYETRRIEGLPKRVIIISPNPSNN